MKKFKLASLLVLTITTVVFSLSACYASDFPDHEHVFSEATCTTPRTCECGETEGEALGHTLVADSAIDPTCTETGLTAGEHCSVCGEITVEQTVVDATGHNHEAVVTPPTCTEGGFTTYTCACGDTYTGDEVGATGHNHEAVVTPATCTKAGVTTYTCACGDTYTENIEKLGHIDENLDVECDRDGCTSKVAPTANSTLSLFTANCLGSKLSTSNKYYVQGTIDEVENVTSGIFWIIDEAGDRFYVRMPKDANGATYSTWKIKLLAGDVVKLYGTINKFSTQSAPGGYYPSMQSGTLVEIVEQHPHDFTFSPADCLNPAICECGQTNGDPLGHLDTDANNLCDRCEVRMDATLETLVTQYNDIKDTENYDATNGTMTWEGEAFTVLLSKGSSRLTTNGTNHFRVQKGNILTISAKDGKKIISITFVATTASYVGKLQTFLDATGYTYTTDGIEVTIEVDSLESVVLNNTASTIARIATVKVLYVG